MNKVLRGCLVQQGMGMRMVADVVPGRDPVVQNTRIFRINIERPGIGEGKYAGHPVPIKGVDDPGGD